MPPPLPLPTTSTNSLTPYLVAVVSLFIAGLIALVAVVVFRPEQDNAVLIAVIMTGVTTSIASVLALRKSQETHLSVNSRLEQWIQTASGAAHAEGRLAGVEEANRRTDVLAQAPSPTDPTPRA